jgi:hypothetical protein
MTPKSPWCPFTMFGSGWQDRPFRVSPDAVLRASGAASKVTLPFPACQGAEATLLPDPVRGCLRSRDEPTGCSADAPISVRPSAIRRTSPRHPAAASWPSGVGPAPGPVGGGDVAPGAAGAGGAGAGASVRGPEAQWLPATTHRHGRWVATRSPMRGVATCGGAARPSSVMAAGPAPVVRSAPSSAPSQPRAWHRRPGPRPTHHLEAVEGLDGP